MPAKIKQVELEKSKRKTKTTTVPNSQIPSNDAKNIFCLSTHKSLRHPTISKISLIKKSINPTRTSAKQLSNSSSSIQIKQILRYPKEFESYKIDSNVNNMVK